SIGNTGLANSLRMPTATVACTPASVSVNQATTCTVTVADHAAGTASIPTGTVTFSPGGICTLSHSGSDPNPESTCSVTITPTATGQLSISADYGGDSTHSGSQGKLQRILHPHSRRPPPHHRLLRWRSNSLQEHWQLQSGRQLHGSTIVPLDEDKCKLLPGISPGQYAHDLHRKSNGQFDESH